MVPKVLDRRSLFGVTCVRCGNDLIAPEKSEHLDDRRIRHLWRMSSLAVIFGRHLWRCQKCGVRFEVFLRFPAEAKSIRDLKTKMENFPTFARSIALKVRQRLVCSCRDFPHKATWKRQQPPSGGAGLSKVGYRG